MIFVRRYMSDRAHRLLTEDTAYCGRRCEIGERLTTIARVGRCDNCEKQHRRASKAKAVLRKLGVETGRT